MSATDIAFAGSIPQLYDKYLGPLLFEPYAEQIARRASEFDPRRLLETAAGTGIVTQALQQALPDAEIVATDLNQAMLDVAAARVRPGAIRFQAGDAQELPFEDSSFDCVVCQFGIMFYPDKVRGNSEARRVLRDGGHYLLAIWDSIDRNLATMAAGRAVADLFPPGSGNFYERVPFRYHDRSLIEADLRAAGFTDIAIETVELRSRIGSAPEAATGLVQGSPMRAEIERIDPAMLEPATAAATAALRQFEGPDGFDAPMSAHIVTATR